MKRAKKETSQLGWFQRLKDSQSVCLGFGIKMFWVNTTLIKVTLFDLLSNMPDPPILPPLGSRLGFSVVNHQLETC